MELKLLSKEEILRAMQTAHPAGEEYPKWTELIGRLKREVESVARAQRDADKKVILELRVRIERGTLEIVEYFNNHRWQGELDWQSLWEEYLGKE